MCLSGQSFVCFNNITNNIILTRLPLWLKDRFSWEVTHASSFKFVKISNTVNSRVTHIYNQHSYTTNSHYFFYILGNPAAECMSGQKKAIFDALSPSMKKCLTTTFCLRTGRASFTCLDWFDKLPQNLLNCTCQSKYGFHMILIHQLVWGEFDKYEACDGWLLKHGFDH